MIFSRFLKDRRGGVAPMLALCIIPLIGFVGAAVDYSHANSLKAKLQAALDATALAMAKIAPSVTPSELQSRTNAHFLAMFNYPDARNITLTPTYNNSGGGQLVIQASATMNTSFMGLIGYPSLNIGSSTTIKWGNTRLRVSLVLDNTGSMNDNGKMPAMQAAAKNLLKQLKDAATTNGDVYVSIIPFSKDVNVGASNYSQSYIRWDLWDAANGSSSGFSGSICYNGTLWTVSGSGIVNGGSCSSPSSGICYNGTLY